MRIYLLTLLLFGFSVIADSGTAWERYLAMPTAEHAQAVSAIEYSDDGSSLDTDLYVLQSQVIGGDIESLRLALRLANQADGGDHHDLLVIVSRSIRSDPENFVSVAEDNQTARRLLEKAVLKVGFEYIDRRLARKYELQERIEAIEGVRDSGTASQRDKFVDILQQAVEAI